MFAALLLAALSSADGPDTVQVRVHFFDNPKAKWVNKRVRSGAWPASATRTKWVALSNKFRRIHKANGVFIDGRVVPHKKGYAVEISGCNGCEIAVKAVLAPGEQRAVRMHVQSRMFFAITAPKGK